MSGPLPHWCEQTCVVCPGQQLGPGQFDVVDRPGPEFAYRPDVGWRATADGVAVCVHPFRVGLPPGRYASVGAPVPVQAPRPTPTPQALELPADVVDLEGWLVAVLRDAPAEQIFTAVARAERLAAERFGAKHTVAALRRVLSVELASR
ncbi:hypothetical protein [Micromonospora chalcea]|uniref:hypothetical protein n=1 Tax=Micromonospora chalcea TaxID=1874 RepID=UPI000CE2BEC2|nr:hypothetical protein [Micromonospora chalcea]PPA60423.1 hypothetical protein BAW75_01320 [Micromonospora chalcea]